MIFDFLNNVGERKVKAFTEILNGFGIFIGIFVLPVGMVFYYISHGCALSWLVFLCACIFIGLKLSQLISLYIVHFGSLPKYTNCKRQEEKK